MAGLASSGRAEVHLVTATRFKAAVPDSLLPVSGFIDEVALAAEAGALAAPHHTLWGFQHAVMQQGPQPNAAQALLLRHIASASAGFQPDMVVTFGMPGHYLSGLWPDAVVLHSEVSAFSRNPFPRSMYFDHTGIYGSSIVAGRGNTDFDCPRGAERLLDDFRRAKLDALAEHDPLADLDLRQNFRHVVLMPLQVSNYFSFDEQCDYRTQFENLVAMLSAAPKDVGVICSEYIQWGEILNHTGAGQNLDWLRDRFPNLIFHEAFRSFGSVSQYLLRHADGIFTVASNLGPQSLLHSKHLATVTKSHLRRLAHHTTLDGFFNAVREQKPVPSRDAFLRWYLSCFAVPMSLIENGEWLAHYLGRRLQAARTGKTALNGFVATDSMDVLRRHWLAPDAEGRAERFETPRAAAARQQVLREAATFIAEESARAEEVPMAGDQRPGYVLVNDTRAIERFAHWGSSTVTRYVQTRLAEMGLCCLAAVNFREDAVQVLAKVPRHRIRLVVFNGEGSLHHDNPRAHDLFAFCRVLHSEGIPCVLLNSVWNRNTEQLGQFLRDFDIVAFRESRSRAEALPWCPHARIVPDFTFAALHDIRHESAQPRQGWVVLDGVTAPVAQSLARFARNSSSDYLLLGDTHFKVMTDDPGSVLDTRGRISPRLFTDFSAFDRYEACVTGRYHGLIAALCAGLPTLAVASNTPKIEGMFEDMGLADNFVLEGDWLDFPAATQVEHVKARLGRWDAASRGRLADYRANASIQIASLWRDIAALVNGPVRLISAAASEVSRSSLAGASTELNSAGQLKAPLPPVLHPGELRDLQPSAPESAAYLSEGFHRPESWGCWSSDLHSEIHFALAHEVVACRGNLHITLTLRVYDALLNACPVLRLSSERQVLGFVFFRAEQRRHVIDLTLPVEKAIECLCLDLSIVDSPAKRGESDDARWLGLALDAALVRCEISPSERDEFAQAPAAIWGLEDAPLRANASPSHGP